MLTKNKDDIRSRIEMLCLDQLVPEDHLVRKLEPAIDFDFIFEQVFIKILERASGAGFIKADAVFIDATHVKANANKKKFDKVLLEKEARSY